MNGSGNTAWEAAYLPFGGVQIGKADVENNLRFPGQYFDAETGLHYNWHRYYDPKTGRYITGDPIGLEGGMNVYVYALNNPTVLTDFLGLSGSRPGGPYHPPNGVKTKCVSSDTCPQIKNKMYILKRMINSHQGWDRHMAPPRGGGRHSGEIGQLWAQYANCQALYARKCECSDASSSFSPSSSSTPNSGATIGTMIILIIITIMTGGTTAG